MRFAANIELVDAGDLDELIRHVDRLAAAADWDGLEDLRHRARRAFTERGRQLWPAATHAEYRLALDAPGPWAAAVVVDGAGHLGPGPLAEVAASTHTWDELADHLPPGPAAAWCAHERVARGDNLCDDARVPTGGPEIPLRLAPWEPTYPAPTYRPTGLEEPPSPAFAQARTEAMVPLTLPDAVSGEEDPATAALVEVVRTWRVASNGRARAVVVPGDAPTAVASLGITRARGTQVGVDVVAACLAWAAASGGAHGRRSGLARGRFEAWWAIAALCGLEDPWPPDPEELGAVASELRWWLFSDASAPAGGWSLHLAVEDPLDGLAWAVAATDHA